MGLTSGEMVPERGSKSMESAKVVLRRVSLFRACLWRWFTFCETSSAACEGAFVLSFRASLPTTRRAEEEEEDEGG